MNRGEQNSKGVQSTLATLSQSLCETCAGSCRQMEFRAIGRKKYFSLEERSAAEMGARARPPGRRARPRPGPSCVMEAAALTYLRWFAYTCGIWLDTLMIYHR